MRSKVDRQKFLGFVNLENRALQGYAVAIVIGGFWLFFGVVIPRAFSHVPALEQAGQFGDMFGAVNSLFSGLALAGIAYTLFQQNKQIEISQKTARIESFTFLGAEPYFNESPSPSEFD